MSALGQVPLECIEHRLEAPERSVRIRTQIVRMKPKVEHGTRAKPFCLVGDLFEVQTKEWPWQPAQTQ